LKIFRFGSPFLAAALLAGCSGGGSALAPANVANAVAAPVSASATRTTQDLGWGWGGGHQQSEITASATSLTFSSPTDAPQTITFTRSDGDEDHSIDVDLSATGVVTIARVKSKHHHEWWGNCWHDWDDDNGGKTISYTVTPVAAGTVNLLVSPSERSENKNGPTLTIPVTVGTGKLPPPSVTLAEATINCSTQTCGLQGSSPLGAFVTKTEFPIDSFTIDSTGYTGSYTVTSTDGNCAVVGNVVNPATVTSTPPTTTVQVDITSTAYQNAQTSVSGNGVATIPCTFTVAAATGPAASVTLSYVIPFPN
jgi:hypothetical protein